MKNVPLIIFFSIISLLSIVVLIILALLPKLCCCFTSFCNKNYKTVKKQNTRARRIKRARLRVLYKSQITHEKPIQIELDRSEGLFFDKETKQKIKDKESLENFHSGLYKTSFLSVEFSKLFLVAVIAIKQKISSGLLSVSKALSYLIHHISEGFISTTDIHAKSYFEQIKNYVSSSVTKYFNH